VTPKEIVRRTLEFDRPERLARCLPEPWGRDFAHVGVDMSGLGTDWEQMDETRWERRDEWGNTWARIDDVSKGEVARGALADIRDADSLPLPPLGDPARYGGAAKAAADNADQFVLGDLPGFTFNIARKMRRIDHYLMDLHLHREAIEVLHDRIDAVLAAMIGHYARAGVDGVMTCEDWGTQLGLMVHPDLWREIFKPRFRRLCGVAREHGLKVLLHSCGKITDIIPDLIEVGVNALQFDQQEVHGIDRLAEHAGRVTYWCPVDIQSALQTGDEAVIRSWARELVEKLWCRGRGGFIAGFYSGESAIGAKPEWQRWASDEFVKVGVQPGE